jgi:hypothetical protein
VQSKNGNHMHYAFQKPMHAKAPNDISESVLSAAATYFEFFKHKPDLSAFPLGVCATGPIPAKADWVSPVEIKHSAGALATGNVGRNCVLALTDGRLQILSYINELASAVAIDDYITGLAKKEGFNVGQAAVILFVGAQSSGADRGIALKAIHLLDLAGRLNVVPEVANGETVGVSSQGFFRTRN